MHDSMVGSKRLCLMHNTMAKLPGFPAFLARMVKEVLVLPHTSIQGGSCILSAGISQMLHCSILSRIDTAWGIRIPKGTCQLRTHVSDPPDGVRGLGRDGLGKVSIDPTSALL